MKKILLRLAVVLFFLLLTACGGGGGSSSSTSTYTGNSAPQSNAGDDQNVTTATIVCLDGSASSDPDQDSLTYLWTLLESPEGSQVGLSSTTVANPTFTADLDGDYVFSLVVNDGQTDSDFDTVTITAATENSAPVADAGDDQDVKTGDTVDLDGGGSTDADGDELTYGWILIIKPDGSSAVLTEADTATPSFTADAEGVYEIGLVVDDGADWSDEDTVVVTATTEQENSPPVADAGDDQRVVEGDDVYLDGTGSSDSDGDELTYQWSFTSRPTGSSAILSNEETSTPGFAADVSGNYILSLIVNDGTEDSSPDNVSIEAVEPGVTLYRDTSSYGSANYSEGSMPYAISGSLSASVSGIPQPITYSIESFKLESVGESFTVVNLSATDNTNTVVPYFDGLSDGTVINDGDDVEFELISPLTNYQTVDLIFQFEIAETGDTFYARYQLTTN